MPDKAVYLRVVDGFADWEPAHAIAELRRHGGYRVETVGLSRSSVVSMGGLCITPSHAVDEIDPKDVAVLILPGGDRWEKMPIEWELDSMLKSLDAQQAPIAAICAATVAISRLGCYEGAGILAMAWSIFSRTYPSIERRRITLTHQRCATAV
jgi:putative intracellular protease/amidase